MSYIDRQPVDRNFLSKDNFTAVFSNFPNMEYFIQSFEFPGVSVPSLNQPSYLKGVDIHGTQIEYDDLSVTFAINEDFSNYREIYNWLVKTGTPQKLEEHQSPDDLDHCTLMITSNNKNTILKVRFDKIFPTGLSSFTFDTTTDHDIVIATATFKFNSMTFDANI